ncbi:uncharacterized protein LOC136075013 [Hydra vulgaris]|uniref:Uncharacterized protein LOC136075013 n=1 Tax=Hydra vulgaris TaxID=6087 RepID=A0ABM4B377_HYDVU
MENGLYSSSVEKEVFRNDLTSDEFISKCCGETSYNIGSEWLRWGRHLGLGDSDLDNIRADNKNCYEKADNVLKKWKQKNGIVSWEQLEKELITFDRLDIVNKIKTKFGDTLSSQEKIGQMSLIFTFIKTVPLLAVLVVVISFLFNPQIFMYSNSNFIYSVFLKNSKSDLSRLSAKLKSLYQKDYWQVSELQPLSKASPYVDLTHKFVDLCIVDAVNTQMDAVFSGDRENFLKKQMNYISISYSEIFTKERSLILISGIAGIGKTWFLRKCLLDWSYGLIWKNVELVFYFECKRLNQYPNISNINELLNVFYKEIVNDFNISSHTAMFIIDGLDEFKYLSELLNPNLTCNYPIVNAFAEIQKYKHVIAGRVYAIDQYQSIYTEYIDELTIQIMGFNEYGINNYVENHVKEEKKEVVKTTLKESPISKAMASVPFYLSSMCKIISDSKKVGSNSFLTMTDLHAHIFSYFIQKHIIKSNKPVYKIMEDSSNKIFILNICKIAYKMFVNNKIVFSKEEIQDFISDFHKNEGNFFGFIEKVETDLGSYYQFAHLTIMEFCASVYAYNYLSSDEIMANERLKSCLPMICGLANKNQDSFLKFLADLNSSKISYNESTILYSILENWFFGNGMIGRTGGIWILDHLIKSYKDFHHLFIECFYESQSSFNEKIKSIIDIGNERRWMWSVSIHDGKSYYLTSCEIYFINHYLKSGRKLTSLSVHKNLLSDEELKLLIQCSTNVRDVYFHRPINFKGWKPKDKIKRLRIWISDYLITKKDFEENFLPWFNLCEDLELDLHKDIDFIEKIYEWINSSNIEKFYINDRRKFSDFYAMPILHVLTLFVGQLAFSLKLKERLKSQLLFSLNKLIKDLEKKKLGKSKVKKYIFLVVSLCFQFLIMLLS